MNFDSHYSSNFSSEDLAKAVEKVRARIDSGNSVSKMSKIELHELVDQLLDFPLGRFLLVNSGLNGYWTHYILNYPRTQIGSLSKLEQVVLNSVTLNATYQRHQIFKRENQKSIKNGAVVASIPSGLMSELLDLDYSSIESISIIAIDLDEDNFAESYKKYSYLYDKYKIKTLKANALELNIKNELDLISSNGLSIYLESDEDLLKMYQNFYSALKEGGNLVTSFLTYPKFFKDKCEQKIFDEPNEGLIIAIFVDILDVKWRAFRTTKETQSLLEKAGFKNIKIFPDDLYIFPTIVGYKIS